MYSKKAYPRECLPKDLEEGEVFLNACGDVCMVVGNDQYLGNESRFAVFMVDIGDEGSENGYVFKLDPFKAVRVVEYTLDVDDWSTYE